MEGKATQENPIASLMAAGAWSEIVAGDRSKVFRVRKLRPAELAQVGLALQFIQAFTARGQRDPGELEAAVESGADSFSPEIAKMLEEMEKIAISAVRAVRLPSARKWWPLRLVRSVDDQDPDRGLVYVGTIAPADVLKLGTAALADLREAATEAAPFPGGS